METSQAKDGPNDSTQCHFREESRSKKLMWIHGYMQLSGRKFHDGNKKQDKGEYR